MIIKRRAIREDTRCSKVLRDLLLKNYEAWLSFARDDLQTDISAKDILLVTGNILTNEWATATVVEKTRHCEIQFSAGFESSPFGSASASVWGSWTSSVSLPLRFGPTSLPPVVPDPYTITRNISNSSDLSDALTIDHEGANQCIFVRGYRILLRPFFLPKIKAAAKPKDEGEKRSDQESNYPIAVRVGIDSDDDFDAAEDVLKVSVSEIVIDLYHPLKLIKQRDVYDAARDYIFMVSFSVSC